MTARMLPPSAERALRRAVTCFTGGSLSRHPKYRSWASLRTHLLALMTGPNITFTMLTILTASIVTYWDETQVAFHCSLSRRGGRSFLNFFAQLHHPQPGVDVVEV